ncbi:YaaA family protein [Paraclostridium sordellii]|uniref:UPF0246 protein ATCC9714_23931 n=2 Tax=Paraclostridium sordellii TaxID=1505 RepID=A0A0A1SJI5_PARSO|nr:YaaA family protein [Paeniclostridium sordellii]MCH1967041.1 YaaA family protein [Paeniclostridium sordellii]MCQ4698189.1 YaaA family protein [Paeniclostridium sordellii]MDU1455057.1 YaaA family protein [Paeniclostridium sordellii]MDU2687913.1 YaaA family protein [Paeniclostridium sordellii]MDU4414192.1 YaaA family protein [Paeniclostridium sordellii]
MITIISPATTMNFEKVNNNISNSNPYFNKEVNYLSGILKELNKNQVSKLMKLSDDLAILNLDRYKVLGTDESPYLQSILAFNGHVFNAMNIDDFNEIDFEFANNHLRVLSGLYGVLKPFDLIQPYRLEMKSKLENNLGNDLYKFWKDKITSFLYDDLSKQKSKILINLASSEYSKAINFKVLAKDFNIINVEFKEFKKESNTYKVIGTYSKKARGQLSSYIIKNKIDDIENLKKFNSDGYKFNDSLSDINNFIFTRQ